MPNPFVSLLSVLLAAEGVTAESVRPRRRRQAPFRRLLEAIGQLLGLTRERVRQLEATLTARVAKRHPDLDLRVASTVRESWFARSLAIRRVAACRESTT